MATLRTPFLQNDYNNVTINKTTIVDFLSGVMKTQTPFEKIIDHLTAYHRPDSGSIQINDFNVTDVDYNPNIKKGQVKINYRVYYFYGCADITKDAGDHETWNFDIDIANNILIVYMPEYEQRSTADEF